MSATDYNSLQLDMVAELASEMFAQLPESDREPRRHCYGLPRVYPKFWMRRPQSNSLMFEWREMQKIPDSKLKDWKK